MLLSSARQDSLENFLGVGVGPPDDEAEVGHVVAVMSAMDTDDLPARGHHAGLPGGNNICSRSEPDSLHDFLALVVEQAHAEDVAKSLVHVEHHGSDAASGINLELAQVRVVLVVRLVRANLLTFHTTGEV